MGSGRRLEAGASVAALAGARPLEPNQLPIWSLVTDLADEVGLPQPEVWFLPSAAPNAFAAGVTPYDAVVCVTDGLLRWLGPAEVRAVIWHELGHIVNGDCRARTAATAGAMRKLGLIEGGSVLVEIAALITPSLVDEWVGIAAGALVRRSARSRLSGQLQALSHDAEHAADAFAGQRGSAHDLAAAIARLDRVAPAASTLPDWLSLLLFRNPSPLSTHPPATERVRLLGGMQLKDPDQWPCLTCGAGMPSSAQFCPRCGQAAVMQHCDCGDRCSAFDRFCGLCGATTGAARCSRCGSRDLGHGWCSCGGALP